MINKKIIINNGDGSVAILHPAPEMFDSKSRTRKLLESKGVVFTSDEEVLQYIISKDVPVGKEHRIVDAAKLPSDRTFRDAWTDDFDTDTVDVDITKAKEIRKNHLRELRKPLLEALDIDFMRALEQGKSTISITSKKQALRDITKVSLPDDLEALKDFIPDILKNV
jgi:hypothetical protein